jgi:hypothetical protein
VIAAPLLVAASIAWALAVVGAPHAIVSSRAALRRPAALVYAAGAVVCHQRSERSFVTRGVAWPVCGRCAGLYLSAPFGAAAALAVGRARRGDLRARRRIAALAARWRRPRGARRLLAVAAAPVALTIVVEWAGVPIATAARAASAAPLGAALAWTIVTAVRLRGATDAVPGLH